MALVAEAMIKKGYIPIAGGEYGAIGWQGEMLEDFWMWNRRFTEYEGGVRRIVTVRVTELKKVALHYWRDGWVPLKEVSGEFLRRMEKALREHPGLKLNGVKVPEGEFLETAESIPRECMGPEVLRLLGLDIPVSGNEEAEPLVRKNNMEESLFKSYKKSKGG